jgi:vacuolar-type H+-ATPase subunit I/STV1
MVCKPIVTRFSIPIALFVAMFLVSVSTQADNLYRYKNDVGGTVVDWRVPPEFAGRGYEVLNAQGQVVEVVPRQLSSGELQNKDLVKRLQQEATVERARLAKWDKFLLLRYSTVEDIDAARDRALRDLKIRLSILASNQRTARNRLESVLARVADMERRGDVPLEQDLDAIAALRADIANTGRAIKEREAQVLEVTDSFDEDRSRFIQLQDVVLLRRSLSRDQTSAGTEN